MRGFAGAAGRRLPWSVSHRRIPVAIHPSDSLAQRNAEAAVLLELDRQLGFAVRGEWVAVGDGCHINVDGINRDHRFLCEVFSRIGKLQAAQVEKVASDILKLTFLAQTLGGPWRKAMCFASDEAANVLRNRSWLGKAAKASDIEIIVVKLPPDLHQEVVAAQVRQMMVNKVRNDG